MDTKRFRTMTSAICMALLAALPFRQAHSRNVSAPSAVSDLTCPSETARPRAATPGIPSAPVVMKGVRMPTERELGALARTVVNPQSVLPPPYLAGVAPGSAARPKRIAFWGDSHLAGGPLAATLMQTLKDRGYRVGARLLPPTMGRANVNLPGLRAYCIGSAWKTKVAYTSPTTVDMGPALASRSVEGGRDAFLWLDVRNDERQADVTQVQLIYNAPAGASLSYALDNGKAVTTRVAATPGPTAVTLGTRVPLSTVKLTVSSGRFDLLGVVLKRPQDPDAIVDVFGLPSATVKGWANADPAAMIRSLHGVTYDAVVLEYGTNEGADADFDLDRYTTALDTALSHLRSVFPTASCVLMGPPDRGVLKNDKGVLPPLLTYGRVHQVIEGAQRRTGARYGCTVWSWQGLMGGPGGSYGWARAQPSLMGRDLIHLSPDGYRLTARSLAHSLGWAP